MSETSGIGTFKPATTNAFFFHIPKTAGTSVSAFFARRYLQGNAFWDSRPFSGVAPVDPQLGVYYGGHVDFDLFQRYPIPSVAFTFLREPRRRLISLYYYMRKEGPRLTDELEPAWRAALSSDLAGWLRFLVEGGDRREGSPYGNDDDNVYLRCLLGQSIVHPLRRIAFEPDGPEMGLARERLRSFQAVGIVEDFVPSMRVISRVLSVPEPREGELGVLNMSAASETPPEITPEIDTLLGELTRYDSLLYADGCERHAEARRQLASPANGHLPALKTPWWLLHAAGAAATSVGTFFRAYSKRRSE
jgi:hypothetical protein